MENTLLLTTIMDSLQYMHTCVRAADTYKKVTMYQKDKLLVVWVIQVRQQEHIYTLVSGQGSLIMEVAH